MQRKALNCLIVMSRLPVAGLTKTRLIPLLGAEGASSLHDRLARHTVARASAFSLIQRDAQVTVWIGGGSDLEGWQWLGDGDFRIQPPGDLGMKMSAAIEEALHQGFSKVVIIGTDCPAIDESALARAFEALDRADMVIGPAEDGGYYLIGMKRACAEVFSGIPWGGAAVLEATLHAASAAGQKVEMLETLGDVDLPCDVPYAEAELDRGRSISVIIPTLNEEAGIADLVKALIAQGAHEVLVSDGGSNDLTTDVARAAGAKVIAGGRGRGMQMNRAASEASGEILFFLHADTVPPGDFVTIIPQLLAVPRTSAGYFRFRLDDSFPAAPLIEELVNFRCRLFRLPYGDQGLFMRRSVFRSLKGFPEWPAMEDIHLVRRLKSIGVLRMADREAVTSSRRWRNRGLIRTTLVHQFMLLGYYAGFPPTRFLKLFRKA